MAKARCPTPFPPAVSCITATCCVWITIEAWLSSRKAATARCRLHRSWGLSGSRPIRAESSTRFRPGATAATWTSNACHARARRRFIRYRCPERCCTQVTPTAAQGNGEVSLTAIETSLTVTLQIILHKRASLPNDRVPLLKNPFGETPEAHIVTGLDKDLDSAMREAVRECVSFLQQTAGLSPDDAYSLASIGVDFEVSQVVDINKGVHAVIPKALFGGGV